MFPDTQKNIKIHRSGVWGTKGTEKDSTSLSFALAQQNIALSFSSARQWGCWNGSAGKEGPACLLACQRASQPACQLARQLASQICFSLAHGKERKARAYCLTPLVAACGRLEPHDDMSCVPVSACSQIIPDRRHRP